MRAIARSLTMLALSIPTMLAAQGAAVAANEWEVPWGASGRPRDPYVAPDGNVYFVGQAGNYIARLSPKDGQFTRFAVDSGTHPHNLLVDQAGMVWYSGNRNGMIGRLDPATGAITRFPMPDAKVRDPHTMVFDKQGNIWFTAQQSNAIGHLDVTSGKVRIVFTGDGTRPYGIVMNSKDVPWFNLFGVNRIATIDPMTMVVKTFDLPDARARGRRIALTSDDIVWYVDYTRGFLGRLDPEDGRITEMPMPGGSASLPYGMASDDKDRIWFAETGTKPNRLIGYDPKTRQFFGATAIGRAAPNTIRHMYFDRKTGLLWFGTDQGTVGRAEVSKARVAM